ncbi:hypothetical protein CU098_005111 [Rhizopus stolonifer]|uniref:Fungal lipase-type domain-containing protein n=1 Tax=Rhizopus stolonifer TaxID=4846 RepID=A0A367KEM0_RHIST|nr:hypothetical protein CU098_005111 [Rhizopus stolonifer]
MKANYIYFVVLILTRLVYCTRTTRPGTHPLWPTIYANDGQFEFSNALGAALGTITSIIRVLKEGEILPNAQNVTHFDATSSVYKDAAFHARLARTSNCRASSDKWDCEQCQSTLPDGIVVRSFSTFPLGVTGNVVLSHRERKIYVMIRGASSFRNKVLFFSTNLVPHPAIPDAHVQTGFLASLVDIRDIVYNAVRDQLQLHPNYAVNVVAHSYGAGVGSLVTVDLFQRLPQLNETNLAGYLYGKPRVGDFNYATFVAENNIQIKRFVEKADDICHRPDIQDGYVHEGDEYWLKTSGPDADLTLCPGPYETRNCSSSLVFFTGLDHLK